MNSYRLLAICLLTFLLSACKTDKAKEQIDNGPGYFSIKGFAADQWKIFRDQPFGIIKVVTLNGKTDSVITNVNGVKWGDVFKMFFDTDISNKKFLDQYTFSGFADQSTMSQNYYYEANNKKLFTQKLGITANINSNKITSIYIETARHNFWGDRTQKLFYVPAKSIIIQEFESSLLGKNKDVKIEYRFL